MSAEATHPGSNIVNHCTPSAWPARTTAVEVHLECSQTVMHVTRARGHVTMSRMTDLDPLASSIHGGKGEGLVVGLPLPYQPLHICGVLKT